MWDKVISMQITDDNMPTSEDVRGHGTECSTFRGDEFNEG